MKKGVIHLPGSSSTSRITLPASPECYAMSGVRFSLDRAWSFQTPSEMLACMTRHPCANVNFDLCEDDGAAAALFGSSGVGLAIGTATQVSCSLYSGTQH